MQKVLAVQVSRALILRASLNSMTTSTRCTAAMTSTPAHLTTSDITTRNPDCEMGSDAVDEEGTTIVQIALLKAFDHHAHRYRYQRTDFDLKRGLFT